MKIFVNGEEIKTQSQNLNDLLLELNYEGDWLATAINAHVIPASERINTPLKENDKIEILSPMQGG